MTDFGDQAILTIDLDALVANWRALAALAPNSRCGGVVKADGYGLGADKVAAALYAAGCRDFFVAHTGEGVALRASLPKDAAIHILHGVPEGAAAEQAARGLIPVLSSPEQIARWTAESRRQGRPLPAALQVDTGMHRLGLQPAEFAALLADQDTLRAFDARFLMSHLGCADEPSHPQNAQQLANFRAALARLQGQGLAGLRASFANSAGILLGPDYQFDLLRPGIGLYGSNPRAPEAGPYRPRPVAHLQAPILQIRNVDSGGSVGYGATYRVEKPRRIATLAAGYADGVLRALSNSGIAAIEGAQGLGGGAITMPIVGRVSMDMLAVDVSAVDDAFCQPGAMVTLFGGAVDIDAQARAAGTIAYELLTRMGPRVQRLYTGGAA
ncbi:alanine racemase [Ferrovibrio sp.]|uniref:alanine racemase n=1 Tax=Ferrovibrio sp. TaxID=1917215 RepID=UPI0035B12F0E